MLSDVKWFQAPYRDRSDVRLTVYLSTAAAAEFYDGAGNLPKKIWREVDRLFRSCDLSIAYIYIYIYITACEQYIALTLCILRTAYTTLPDVTLIECMLTRIRGRSRALLCVIQTYRPIGPN